MSFEFAYWLIPGYFCLLVYNGARGIKHQGTWDFLVKLAPASAICALVTQAIIVWIELTPGYRFARFGLSADILGQREVELITGLVVAILVGLLAPKPVYSFLFVLDRIRKLKWLYLPTDDSPNLFSVECRRLAGKMVQVSLRNGKVYGAYLISHSFDDKAPAIQIAPFISGYRKQDLRVMYNTLYFGKGESLKSMKHRLLIVPLSEISSMAELDFDFMLHMLEHGTLEWEVPESQTAREAKTESDDLLSEPSCRRGATRPA